MLFDRLGQILQLVVATEDDSCLAITDLLNNIRLECAALVLKVLVRRDAIKLEQRTVLLPRQTVADD